MTIQTKKTKTVMAMRHWFVLSISLVFCSILNAQEIRISGTVSDELGQPLPGASIVEKGTANGVTSDFDGNYSITVSDGYTTLVFSYVGYLSKEVGINARTSLDVALEPDVAQLDNVVVVGYGTQKKAVVTGAVAAISADEITQTPVTGFDQALQGRISGVQVTQNSGEPGGSVSVRIRGVGSLSSSNEPLYVVDGIPYTDGINNINPNDIERIDVLKDAASAAIYGSRASNGVVLITTKRGKVGKLTTTLDTYTGFSTVNRKIDLLNGPDFARLANQSLANAGEPTNPAWDNPSSLPSYDWQDAMFTTAVIHSTNVSISGGGEKMRNLLSLGYFDQGGVVAGSDFKRYSARYNIDYDITDKLRVGGNISLSFVDQNLVGVEDGFSGVVNTIIQMQPTDPIKTSQEGAFGDHLYGWNGYSFTRVGANATYYPVGLNNPIYFNRNHETNTREDKQILGSLFAEYDIIPELKAKTMINVNQGDSFAVQTFPNAPAEITGVGPFFPSVYNESWSRFNEWNWINTLSFNKLIGKHNFGMTVGTDVLERKQQFVNIGTVGVPDGQQNINASDVDGRQIQGFPAANSLVSYFGRVNYEFDEKYLLTATIRHDGSSKFGPNNKFGTFPSVSAGWRISEENFLKESNFVDELKLRASYGEVGNQNIGDFRFLNTFTNDAGLYEYTLGTGETSVVAIRPNNFGDPDIQWEVSTQTNFGLDASFLKGKLSLVADYYIKDQEKLLGFVPVPNFTGVPNGEIFRNGFSLRNKGLELALGYRDTFGDFGISVDANFATLDNELTELFASENSFISQSISVATGTISDDNAQTRSQVGERAANFWGYVTDGIFQNAEEVAASGQTGVSPGDRRYKDLNGDGVVNSNDKTIIGNGIPGYTYGLNIRTTYKNFDFSVFLNGQGDVDIANMTKFFTGSLRYFNTTGMVNGSADLVNSWTGPGTSNSLPRLDYDAPTSNRFFSDAYIEDGSFLRIQNIQLGYTLPNKVNELLGIQSLRIYSAVQNLYTFTSYSGYDPEVGSALVGGQRNVLTTGTDYGRYPVPTTLTVGLNLKF